MKSIAEIGNILPKIIANDKNDKPYEEISLSGPCVNPEFPNADDVWKSNFKKYLGGLGSPDPPHFFADEIS